MITLQDLRIEVAERGSNPRVHPNGFLQLDLGPVEESWDESKKAGHSGAERRLHIWNPPGIDLPHQGTTNEIHDHVFDMRSTIVRGRLIQRLYWFVVGSEGKNDHELYRAVYDKKSSSRLEATGILGQLKMADRFTVDYQHTYTQPAFTLHDTETPYGLVVTVMEKTEVREGTPSVICPVNKPPDNDFDRASAAPVDLLWYAIKKSLDMA